MGNIFAGSEVVELGVQIEKNGRDFYNTLAKQSENNKAAQIFKYLAGEEEKHILVFKKLLEKMQKYEAPAAFADEYIAYMKALASDYVFIQSGKGEEIARGIKSDKEAAEMGIKFEKDSILFYEGMKKMVPVYDHKIIEELIQQEQGHLLQLSDLRKTIFEAGG